MVHHIKRSCHALSKVVEIDSRVHHKDSDQSDVLKHQSPSLAKIRDPFSKNGRNQHVRDERIYKQRCNLVDVKTKALHHHKGRENDENLPPRARHELQRVIKPIAFPQHHLLQLRVWCFELRKHNHAVEGD